MSDVQKEPDWWLATDGKWYPPAAPAPPPPSEDQAPNDGTPPDPSAARQKRLLLALAGLLVVVVLVGGGFVISRVTAKPTTSEVSGVFVVFDEDFRGGTGTCSGSGGYGDINSSTAVVLKAKDGTEIDRTSLGMGDPTSGACTFRFELEVTEGSEYYVLSVGRRGESQFTWKEITTPGAIALSLGEP